MMQQLAAGIFGVAVVSTAAHAQSESPAATVLHNWNIRYAMPAGWQLEKELGRIQVLASKTDAGAIFIAPGQYAEFNEVATDVSAFYQSMGQVAFPVAPPQSASIAGLRAMTGAYQSQDQSGRLVSSRVVVLLTPHETGLVVMGMTTPQQMPRLRETVDRLASTVQASPPTVNGRAIAALRGRWMYYAGRASGVTSPIGGTSHGHEEYATFDGRGLYQWQSSSSVSASASLGLGDVGSASATSDQGSYSVIGSTLVLNGQWGQRSLHLQILAHRIIADGRTYLRAN